DDVVVRTATEDAVDCAQNKCPPGIQTYITLGTASDPPLCWSCSPSPVLTSTPRQARCSYQVGNFQTAVTLPP
ncbi:unnamed protein product, partial [Symbiodinium necroappetens]